MRLISLFWAFFVTGGTAFGGGTIAHLRERLVKGRAWLTDDEFLKALQLGQILPGIVVTNVSVMVGDRLRGPAGALVAWLGMMIPGALFMAGLALGDADPSLRTTLNPALRGVAAAAVGLLAAVAFQIGRTRLRRTDLVMVLLTAVGSGYLGLPLPLLLAILAPASIWLNRPKQGASAPREP